MRTVPKDIRQEINYLAHRLALAYENEVRDSMLAELIEDVEAGATTADMIKSVRDYEQAAKSAR